VRCYLLSSWFSEKMPGSVAWAVAPYRKARHFAGGRVPHRGHAPSCSSLADVAGGFHPTTAAVLCLSRSYLILSMQIRATTCRDVVQGKTAFWLRNLGRSGERAVRRRSLVIKELPRSTLPLVFLATHFGPFCKVFAGHQPFAADTPT